MIEILNKKKHIIYPVLSFVFFVFLFSLFRERISLFNTWCLALTGELEVSDSPEPYGRTAGGISAGKTGQSGVNTAGSAYDPAKSVVTELPKTKRPEVLFIPFGANPEDFELPFFPALRKYSGEEWSEERTRIAMATDGFKLFVFMTCFDKHPENLVTEFSEVQNVSIPWRDDSVELFLMKDREAGYYCQYITSVSGLSRIYYYLVNPDDPRIGNNQKLPDGFSKPLIYADRFPEGYKIKMIIHLDNLSIENLKAGDELLVQIVRNYRGQGGPNSIALHLFPAWIYADNRFGLNNHDRRAFQPVYVVGESHSEPNPEKDKNANSK